MNIFERVEEIKKADKYIDFVLTEEKPKTKVYEVRTKDGFRLGIIKWYPAWRHYCFFPEPDTLHSDRCLLRIGIFIEKLNDEHKKDKGVE